MSQLDPTALGHRSGQIETFLRASVIGQDDALTEIVTAWVKDAAGLSCPGRPIANLLFTGPSGVGKTLAVEVLAEALVHDRRALVKIDCAEFQHSHEIAKLVGSPPGYLGHRETRPLLSQEAIEQYHTDKVKLSFVLFDEIEKASDALWNLLLGILDKASLTLGDNRKVDFSRTMIFMTSNMGSHQIESLLHPRLGFSPAQGSGGQVQAAGLEAVRKRLTPEFRNRLDRVIVFRPLSREQIGQVLEIELVRLNRRILAAAGAAMAAAPTPTPRRRQMEQPVPIRVSDQAKQQLVQDGYRPEFGARHLTRAIELRLVQPLARLVDSGQVELATGISVDWDTETKAFQYFA
jgi:ATP-dependent Clp protease ATP-binding subunit ClpB